LNTNDYTRENEKEFANNPNADIITLVQYNKQCSFLSALKYLHKILDIEYKYSLKLKENNKSIDPLFIFKKVSCGNRVDVNDLIILNEELLDEYLPILHISWLREGVMPWTAKKFGLSYSFRKKRIIIPLRYWMTGELLGTNSRTTIENYKEFGIKKFFITPSYPKYANLFGLYENYQYIQEAGYVVVYESEKSVLKRDSLGSCNSVALSGHIMSDEQVRILIGLNVNIIISLDNDIDIQESRFICEKFYGIRNVSYTYDKWDLLGEKDSIADMPNKIYDFLIEHRVPYDYIEHQKFINSK
jgi:DNA primase